MNLTTFQNHAIRYFRFRRSICLIAIIPPLTITALAEPAMWVVRDQDSTIYLVGTVHLLRHEAEWRSAKLEKALIQSSELWLELADPDNQAAAMPLIQQYGIDKEKPLSQKLSAVQNEKLARLSANYNIPRTNLEPIRPWLVGLTFTVLPLQKAGYDPKAGVDWILKEQAEKKGEKIVGFETLEEQVRFLAELSESDQIAFLDDTLDDVAKGIALFDKLATAWMNGDSTTIGDLLVKEMKEKAPSVYQKLVVQRNVRWADKIDTLLHGSGVQLIAVGAAHLVGPDSVQVQLANRGIKAEPY